MLSPDPGPPRPDPRPRRPLWLPAVGLLACVLVAAVGWWFAPDLTPPDAALELQPLPPPPQGGAVDLEAQERRRAAAHRDLSESAPEETPPGREVGFDRQLAQWATDRRLLVAAPDKLTVVGPNPTDYTAASLTGNPQTVLDPHTAAVAPDGRWVAVSYYDRPLPIGPSQDPWPEPQLLVLDLRTGTADRPVLAKGSPVRLTWMTVNDGAGGRSSCHWLGDMAFVVRASQQTKPAAHPGGVAESREMLLRYDVTRPGTFQEVSGLPTVNQMYADRPGPLLVNGYDTVPDPRPLGRTFTEDRLYQLNVNGLRPAGPDDRRRYDEFAAAERANEEVRRWVGGPGSISLSFGYTTGRHRIEHFLWPADPDDYRDGRHVEVLRLNGRLVRRLPPRKCVTIAPGMTTMDPLISEVRWDADLGLYRWLEREPDGHRYDTFVSDAAGHVRRWHPGRYAGLAAPVPRP